MADSKKKLKQTSGEGEEKDSLWRKPITLDSFDEDDPLAALYRGREFGAEDGEKKDEPPPKIKEKTAKSAARNKTKASETAKAEKPPSIRKKSEENEETEKFEKSEKAETEFENDRENPNQPISSKISEAELKNILKIKSESFHFTDLREILRGKSFDIYAYLRLLSGDSGVCKIKHLDLMKKLDISRPTLFKQGDWLMRLSLIEKRSVPGDHLGTSYTVRRLEDVLPVSENLFKQIETQIEIFRQELS